MPINQDLDLRTLESHPPALENEKEIFDRINLELNLSALFGISTASISYKIVPWTHNLVRNHGWLGYLNILMVNYYSRA